MAAQLLHRAVSGALLGWAIVELLIAIYNFALGAYALGCWHFGFGVFCAVYACVRLSWWRNG